MYIISGIMAVWHCKSNGGKLCNHGWKQCKLVKANSLKYVREKLLLHEWTQCNTWNYEDQLEYIAGGST
jgi:hypothetical protein